MSWLTRWFRVKDVLPPPTCTPADMRRLEKLLRDDIGGLRAAVAALAPSRPNVSVPQVLRCASAGEISEIRNQISDLKINCERAGATSQEVAQLKGTLESLKNVVHTECDRIRSTTVPSYAENAAKGIKAAVIAHLVATGESALLPSWQRGCNEKIAQIESEREAEKAAVARTVGELTANNGKLEGDLASQRCEAERELRDAREQGSRALQESENRRQADAVRAQADFAAKEGLLEKAHEMAVSELVSGHARDKAASEQSIAELNEQHARERGGWQQSMDELKARMWPPFLREESLHLIRDSVGEAYCKGAPDALCLYGELVKLAGVSDRPQELLDQVVPLGRAFYAWFNTFDKGTRPPWDDAFALWLTSIVSRFGFVVLPVKIGERYNVTLHNCANVNGDTVSVVKSFLLRNQAGVAKSLAVVELRS